MLRNKQSTRSLVAFLLAWSSIVFTLTGLVLYVVPPQRIAAWTQWSLAGLGKQQWGGLHTVFGLLFVLSGALHLYLNWQPFKKYLAECVGGRLRASQELILSLALTLLVVVLSVSNLPPARWVFQFGDALQSAWVSSPESEPPFGHAEEVSLAGFAKRMGLDLDNALVRLWDEGLVFSGPKDSLKQIAFANDTTPMAIYALIRDSEREVDPVTGPFKPADIEARFGGTGLGRKTLAQICADAGLDESLALQRLEAAGIRASAQDKMKVLAERYDLNPMDLLKIMIIPGFRPDT